MAAGVRLSTTPVAAGVRPGSDMDLLHDLPSEWLEADGLGGFAMGTEPGHRTRRYHALLCVASRPPLGRVVLVNGLEVWVEGADGIELLSTQVYRQGVIHPDGYRRIELFESDPWPCWTFRLADGAALSQECFVPRGQSLVALRWSLSAGSDVRTLYVRPLLSGRNYHHLHAANNNFRFDCEESGDVVRWQPYRSLPVIEARGNGSYSHAPQWYYEFLYLEERRRGLDCHEDLASPGLFRFELGTDDAILLFAAAGRNNTSRRIPIAEHYESLREKEAQRRSAFPTRLQRAGDSYFVKRGDGLSVIAGYPWFGDWGRDTFIALRGLCLATGRLAAARDILLAWSRVVSEGMLPNRFTDGPEGREYNSVDASLWYVVAAGEYIQRDKNLPTDDRTAIESAIEAILDGYAAGTRYGIHLAEDGLIAAGEPGVQLTWMDAKVGDWVVTPRIGKPVEIQALWLNALRMSSHFESKWSDAYRKGLDSFRARFWHADGGYLYDVVDVDHRAGKNSAEFRPNQLFAVGGLPEMILPSSQAKAVITAVEERLWTPAGPRSLSPNHPAYQGTYRGGVLERDGAYHQGTVWPWLAGAFIEGWYRVHGQTPTARREARARFLEPLLDGAGQLGRGHLAEIADGDAPHTPRGCPFQAWSVAEALRLSQDVLAERA